jgi:hypothetical protein
MLAAFARRQPAPRHLTRQQVAAALANVLDLDNSGTHDEFDLFLGRPVADAALESIRQECLAVIRTDSRPERGHDLGPNAEQWIRQKLAELQQQA